MTGKSWYPVIIISRKSWYLDIYHVQFIHCQDYYLGIQTDQIISVQNSDSQNLYYLDSYNPSRIQTGPKSLNVLVSAGRQLTVNMCGQRMLKMGKFCKTF